MKDFGYNFLPTRSFCVCLRAFCLPSLNSLCPARVVCFAESELNVRRSVVLAPSLTYEMSTLVLPTLGKSVDVTACVNRTHLPFTPTPRSTP